MVENRGGAAHSQAMTVVARSQPDAYTLMVGEAGGYVNNPAIYPKGKLDYDEKKDFIPITGLVRINQALLAKKGYDPLNGARPLGRVIQDEIKRPLTDEMLFGKLASGGTVRVDVAGDKVTFVFNAAKELLPVN